MQPYPHTYIVAATGSPVGSVEVSADGLSPLHTAPPSQFGGPGDLWSPETLLCAAVANCFILTFRGIARASGLEWLNIDCRVEGTLERSGANVNFTRFVTNVELEVPDNSDPERCRKLLEKAEHGCLVANSLRGARSLQMRITASQQVYG